MYFDLDTDHPRAFLAAAEQGGLTRAASRLHGTQSAVSVQIQKLEARLGHVLFTRAGRAVQLRPKGEMFRGYARRMLAPTDETAAAFAPPPMAGAVRLGVMDDYATRVVPASGSRCRRA